MYVVRVILCNFQTMNHTTSRLFTSKDGKDSNRSFGGLKITVKRFLRRVITQSYSFYFKVHCINFLTIIDGRFIIVVYYRIGGEPCHGQWCRKQESTVIN